MDTKKLLAELLGTFAFFLIGFMAILSTKAFPGGPDLVIIGFGFGLGLFVGIQAFGAISGGHYNPAVTVAAVLDGRLDPITGVGYVVSQLIGGIGAAAFVLTMSSQAAVAEHRDAPGQGDQRHPGGDHRGRVHGDLPRGDPDRRPRRPRARPRFAIALTLLVIHFAIVPFTGSSVNPARSIASAVIGQKDLGQLWIYIVGPVVGGALGWAVYRFVNGDADAA